MSWYVHSCLFKCSYVINGILFSRFFVSFLFVCFLNHFPRLLLNALLFQEIGSAIGSSIVALKRNQIGIAKIVHLFQDQVATHVHRWHHDPAYNQTETVDLDSMDMGHDVVANSGNEDEIDCVYESFHLDQIDQKLHDIIDDHGRESDVFWFCRSLLSNHIESFSYTHVSIVHENVKHLILLLDLHRTMILILVRQTSMKHKETRNS
jgi:hypothetical protein